MDFSLSSSEISQLSHFYSIAIWNMWNTPDEDFDAFKRYCQELLNITRLGKLSVFHSLALMRTFRDKYPTIINVQGSQYRLVITTLMIANKFLDDCTFTNKTWSTVTYRSLREINCMEKEFLNFMKHDIRLTLFQHDSWAILLDGFIREFYAETLILSNDDDDDDDDDDVEDVEDVEDVDEGVYSPVESPSLCSVYVTKNKMKVDIVFQSPPLTPLEH